MPGYPIGQRGTSESPSDIAREYNAPDRRPRHTAGSRSSPDFADVAGRAVQENARQGARLRGMGTTLTAAAIVGMRLYFAHVGDSRLYLFRKGGLRALTRDHSLVARLVESGVIRAQDADSHPQRHALTARNSPREMLLDV